MHFCLQLFAVVKHFHRQILFVTADGEVEIHILCLAQLGQHIKELNQLLILSANDLKGGVDQNIRHVVVAGADTGQEAVKRLTTADTVCIGLQQASLRGYIVSELGLLFNSHHIAVRLLYAGVHQVNEFFGFA